MQRLADRNLERGYEGNFEEVREDELFIHGKIYHSSRKSEIVYDESISPLVIHHWYIVYCYYYLKKIKIMGLFECTIESISTSNSLHILNVVIAIVILIQIPLLMLSRYIFEENDVVESHDFNSVSIFNIAIFVLTVLAERMLDSFSSFLVEFLPFDEYPSTLRSIRNIRVRLNVF